MINMLLWKNSFRRHKQGSTIFTMSRFGWKVCGRDVRDRCFRLIKAGIDALVQKNGENTDRVRDLTRDLEKSEQALADTEKKLRDREWELAQSQRENQQLKQQIYNLQHPQQSWDEPER